MLDLKLIRTQPDTIRELCRRRHATVDFDKLLELDERTRGLTAQLDAQRSKRKGGGGKPANADEAREAAIALRNEIAALEEELKVAKDERDRLLSWLPNL